MVDSGEYRAEADLLHPLATLHWEHCHTWRGVSPTHCAVLHDRVAILTSSTGSNDVLHISTDLRSWTTTTLPYKDMSLTTYQSMFVAVGGRHPSTYKPTNLLFTSDTGLKWKPSLHPMPTKRSHTSSVSTRSPEVLVVASGQSSGWTKLNVVELLLGDQWSTVDPLPPLPELCHSMQSTFHYGNIYFVGGGGQCAIVYTCSCTSLVSSCGNNTTTDRPLWRQFRALWDHTAVVSYSSHLVSINSRCIIRAYSSVSQSWVEATSTGDRRDGYTPYVITKYVAAAVLPTGELVYAHQSGGVYKVKLSVSSFNPDSRFVPNVLSRLESVMGIQIVCALANIHSQLTTTSGVQLQAKYEYGHRIVLVPDPQTDPGRYVEMVFFQWSGGHSHRPPTWRELLKVLRDIGLVELSQQIDTFMKAQGLAVTRILELLTHKELFPEIQLQLSFIAENCQRLATTLTSLEETKTPIACTVYNSMDDLKAYLNAGKTKTSFGPKSDVFLDKFSALSKRKAIKSFQGAFGLSFDKLTGHLSSLPAYQQYKSVRIFDPRQLPALDHDIQIYGTCLQQLSHPSHQLLEEWLIYTQYREEAVLSLANLQEFWDSMSSRFPLLSKIATECIWMPVSSVDVERSFSNYKHLMNDRRERLTEENIRRLMILYYNGDIEQRF